MKNIIAFILLIILVQAFIANAQVKQQASMQDQSASIQYVNAAGIEELIKGHIGQPVLVSLWIDWDKDMFDVHMQNTAEFIRRFSSRGLVIIQINFDGENPRTDNAIRRSVRELLRYGMEPPYYQFKGKMPRQILGFQTSALPTFALFDSNGNLMVSAAGLRQEFKQIEQKLGEIWP
jgi:hypothetical protein